MKGLLATLAGVLAVAGAGSASVSALAAPARTAAKPVAAKASTPKPAAPKGPLQGYLAAGKLPDAIHLLGPPPPEGSGTKTGDVATYEATRLLQGSERWLLAAHDAVISADAMMQDFSCALGVDLTAAHAPALHRLLERVALDADAAQSTAKKYYRRPRPFVENGGPICVEAEDWLKRSYSYPSGHSTYSWTVGLALSQIAPEHAETILARARVYAESRVVCGVHYQSDIQAGRITATEFYAALLADPEFRRDLEHARLELKRLGAHPVQPPAAECRLEARAEASPVW